MDQTPKTRMSPSAIIIAIIIFQAIAAGIYVDTDLLPFALVGVVILVVSMAIARIVRAQRDANSGTSIRRPFEQSNTFGGNGAGSASHEPQETFQGSNSATAPVRLILVAVLALGGVVFAVISVIGEVGSPALLYIVGGIVAVALGVGAAVWSTRKR